MNVCIRVKMKSEYIYDMLLFHMYSRLSGFLINMTGLAIIIMGGLWLRAEKLTLVQALVYVFIGLSVLVYTPLSLKMRADKIVKQQKYQSEIEYQFGNNGFTELISGKEVNYDWANVKRAVSTPKDIVFYMEDSTVLVFPKVSLQEDFMDLMKLIVCNMTREQVYIR
ncbi:MAG: YcxB family protein [Lachnospiraceae bacterium]